MDSGSLLLGFLDFYGNHFDPRVTGISVGRSRYFSRSAPLPPVPAPPPVAAVPGPPSGARLFYGQVSESGKGVRFLCLAGMGAGVGGGVLFVTHGRSRTIVGLCIPTMPGRKEGCTRCHEWP